ncbi:MAG: hypothetical protein ATN32_08945 [Candidatus Epulonipiscium fishelsonii]|nr:MAG: hypothetical protein ATN32_08945 [Epulopiscium sp. AS2M-Bin002]
MEISLNGQPPVFPNQNVLPIQIPKQHLKQWVAQAIGGVSVIAGSSPIDVIKEIYKNNFRFGMYVKIMSCKVDNDGNLKNTASNEISLAQNINILKKKLLEVQASHDLDKIYYIFLLRANTTFHLCGIKVNIDNMLEMKSNDKTQIARSIRIDNLIDERFGNRKI